MKFFSSSIVFLFTISAILIGCKNSSNETVDLKFNLDKGKTYLYKMNNHFDIDMEMMGKKMSTGGDMDFGFKMKIDDVDNQGNKMISTTYDAIRFKVSTMGANIGYDSKNAGDTTNENPASTMFRKMFGGMVGKTFKITMTPKGGITKIEGIKEIMQSVMENVNVPAEAKAQMEAQMQQSFSDDQVKQNFGFGFDFYPEKPVKIGDSWSKNLDRSINNMKMNMDMKYTLKDIKEKTVLIDVAGKIKTSGNESDKATGVNMNGDTKGSMEIDKATGTVNHCEMEMTIKGTVPGLSQPMDMKSKITIEAKQE